MMSPTNEEGIHNYIQLDFGQAQLNTKLNSKNFEEIMTRRTLQNIVYDNPYGLRFSPI